MSVWGIRLAVIFIASFASTTYVQAADCDAAKARILKDTNIAYSGSKLDFSRAKLHPELVSKYGKCVAFQDVFESGEGSCFKRNPTAEVGNYLKQRFGAVNPEGLYELSPDTSVWFLASQREIDSVVLCSTNEVMKSIEESQVSASNNKINALRFFSHYERTRERSAFERYAHHRDGFLHAKKNLEMALQNSYAPKVTATLTKAIGDLETPSIFVEGPNSAVGREVAENGRDFLTLSAMGAWFETLGRALFE